MISDSTEILALSGQAANQVGAMPPPVTVADKDGSLKDWLSRSAENIDYLNRYSTYNIFPQQPHTLIPTNTTVQQPVTTPSIDDLWNINYSEIDVDSKFNEIRKSLRLDLRNPLDFKRARLYPHGYTPTLSVIAGCKPDFRYDRIIKCGIKIGSRNFRCAKDRLCPLCSSFAGRKRTRKFQNLFHRGSWVFCTISFKPIQYSAPNSYEPLDYWEACQEAVKSLIMDGNAQGAVSREEFVFLSIEPILVNPHAHFILCNPQKTIRILKHEIASKVKAYLAAKLTNPQPANVQVKAIANQQELENNIGYLNKSLDLLRPYERAVRQAYTSNSDRLYKINRRMRDCLEWFHELTKGRIQFRSRGVLDARRGDTLLPRKGKAGRPKGAKNKARQSGRRGK